MGQVTRTSMFTGERHTREIEGVTQEQADAFLVSRGTLVQDAFPNHSKDDREFLKSGVTPEEWARYVTGEEWALYVTGETDDECAADAPAEAGGRAEDAAAASLALQRRRRIIRADGTEEDLPAPITIREVHRRLGEPSALDTVLLRHLGNPLVVMLVVDVAAGLPDNAKATALYHANCMPGTTWRIRGDVVVVLDDDVQV